MENARTYVGCHPAVQFPANFATKCHTVESPKTQPANADIHEEQAVDMLAENPGCW